MERLSSMSIKLCHTCFKMISQRTNCSKCTGRRLFSSTGADTLTCNFVCLNIKPQLFVPESMSRMRQWPVRPLPFQCLYKNSRSCSAPLARSFSTEPPGPITPRPPPRKTKSDTESFPFSWKNLLIIAGVGGIILLGLQHVKKEKDLERQKAQNRLLGKAKLGGDWTLTDHHGKKRSNTDFQGQWILIYFGFTHCPDICPEEIEKIVKVINTADNDKTLPKVQPIIITVDPERDTPEALKEYCGEFSPRLLGFTGTEEEIHKATRAFRVYYSAGPKDQDSDYIVDHSIISYLINPRGEFVDYFGQNKTADQIYSTIRFHIMAYKEKEKKSS